MGAPAGPPDLNELMKDGTAVRRFALALYGQEGVSAACLTLQEDAGVDVNVLLFAAFMGAGRGLPLNGPQATEARAGVAAWHRDIVKALRSVRRRLKEGPSPTPNARTACLRQKIQAIEIEAELIELDTLDALSAVLPGAPSSDQPEADAAAGMAAVVTDAASRAPTAAERAAIDLIARQAAQVAQDTPA